MITINPNSIADLIAMKENGAPVTMTSHPGNASLYKLSLWSVGIPETLWDVTCCRADANNWPMFRLFDGKADLLVDEALYQRVVSETSRDKRFVTAFQKTSTGERLGRYHVRVCEKLFPGRISSCSQVLLAEKDKLREVFEFLAETRSEVFSRFIDSEGIMRPINESDLKKYQLADSFLGLLEELAHLLFSDEDIEIKGGACYDGVMVPLSIMLVQYWQTGRIDRYDISGPDMIHYAMKPDHQRKLSEMLNYLHSWNPELIPKNIVINMYPGTVARVGHVPGHFSQDINARRIHIFQHGKSMSGEDKKHLRAEAKNDELNWPMQIDPKEAHYFSQHDLESLGKSIEVDSFWMNKSFEEIRSILSHMKALLRI